LSAERVLSAEAPAKINRELRVGARRDDGYHEIRSRLVSIDLSDTIEVAAGQNGVELSCEGIRVPDDDSNLVAVAARALADRLRRPADARIRLTKRIPVGAGLGGGSSDAARTLALLATLWEARLTPAELSRLAAGIGSDVPYFLVGGEAEISGRGELVVPIPDSPSVDLTLLVPPFSISTGAVYAAFERDAREKGDRRLPPSLEVQSSGKFFGPNDLAFSVLRERAEMSVLLDYARSQASEAAITGSGSTIVMKGASPDAAARIASRYPEARLQACRTLSRDEYRLRTESSGGSQWRSRKSRSSP
jgi:4-diphosphocytidyl-2-C-methyl-D-erythritol kinase